MQNKLLTSVFRQDSEVAKNYPDILKAITRIDRYMVSNCNTLRNTKI